MKIRSLGRYEVRAELGRGTMGIVYRGYDPVLDREIALKTVDLPLGLDPERKSKFLERFFLEAKIAGRLIHPNIVVTHDAATDETTTTPFIAMELLSGDSLHARLQHGPLPWQEALSLAEPLARALSYAHEAHVVHRDIKPANVLLTAKGVPKIADFGIAKLPDTQLTQSGKILGTPYFMSPEQIQADEVDGRSDVFSLGALLYNLLTGIPPFRGSDLASITQQVLYKSPPPPSELVAEIPVGIDGVLARSMAKDRDERYQTGDELADDLALLRRGEPAVSPLSFGEKTAESATVKTDAEPELEPEPEAQSKSLKSKSARGGCFVLSVLMAAFAAAGVYRRDDAIRLLESLRERRDEVERRDAVSVEGAAVLEEAQELLERGELERCAKLVDQALAAARDARDGHGEATALLWRGQLEAERGAWSKARADLEASASVYAIYDSPQGEASAVAALADLERDLGRFQIAATLYDRADPTVDTTFGRALMKLMQGDVRAAEQGFEASSAWAYVGAVALARGDVQGAEKAWSRARPSSELERFRGFAAHAGSAPAGPSEKSEDGDVASVLQEMFRTEPATPRSEERRLRLP